MIDQKRGSRRVAYITSGDSDVILFQLIFAAILFVRTPRNVCHCDSAQTRFVGKSVITWTFSVSI